MSLNVDRSEWRKVKFGDVAVQVKDKVDPSTGVVDRYVAGEHMDTDELRIVRWGDVGKNYLGPAFHMRFKPGQVLYGSRRTYLRKVALADFEGVCANTTFVIEPRDERVLLREFLPLIMTTESFHAHSKNESKGSVNPYVNWPDLAKYEFDLPPLEEQRRIADLLWAVERHIQAMHAQRDSSWSVLTAAVDGLSHLEYPVKKVRETLSVARGGSPRPINDYLTTDGSGVNWIKIGDISPDGKYIDRTSDKIRKEGTSKSRQVRPGDLLLSNSMSFGRPYIVRIEGYIHDGWLMLADKGGNWRSEYLYFLLRSEAVQKQFRSQAGGSTVKNLNKDRVAVVEVPVPPIQVQDRELARLNNIERSVASIDAEITSCIELRRLLMLGMFEQRTGDLP